MPDIETRLRMLENQSIQIRADQLGHEKLCAERYDAIHKDIKYGFLRMHTFMKWLAIAVGILALVVTGQATLQDVMRSGAAHIGVQVQTNPQR